VIWLLTGVGQCKRCKTNNGCKTNNAPIIGALLVLQTALIILLAVKPISKGLDG